MTEHRRPGLDNSYWPDRPVSITHQVNNLLHAGRCEDAMRMASEHFDETLANKVQVVCKP